MQMEKIIVILGSGRSGTSLLMNLLHTMGMDVSSDLNPASESNPKGTWEDARIFRESRSILAHLNRLEAITSFLPLSEDWLSDDFVRKKKAILKEVVTEESTRAAQIWGFKEPVTPILLPLWKEIFHELGLDPIYLLTVRDPAAVLQSFRTAYAGDPRFSELSWLRRNCDSIINTQANFFVVHYEDWFAEPLPLVAMLRDYTGLTPKEGVEASTARVLEAIDGTLNRAQPLSDYEMLPATSELYELLKDSRGLSVPRERLLDCARAWDAQVREPALSIDIIDRLSSRSTQQRNRIETLGRQFKTEHEKALSLSERFKSEKTRADALARDHQEEKKRAKALARDLRDERDRADTLSTNYLESKDRLETLTEKHLKAKQQIGELDRQLGALSIQAGELKRLRQTTSYQLGSLLVRAVARPGKRTLRLPLDLLRLYRRQRRRGPERRAIVTKDPKRPAPSPELRKSEAASSTIPNLKTIPSKPGRDIRNKANYEWPNRVEHRFDLFREVAPYKSDKTTNLRIACIVSPHTHRCLDPDAKLLPLSESDWESELPIFDPDFLLVESTWQASDGDWKYRLVVGDDFERLKAVLDYCRSHSIPSIFWNTEDSTHYHSFRDASRLFDCVFASDECCVERYRKDLDHDRIFHLPLAIQPAIHNPAIAGNVPKHMRQFSVLFDGWADLLEAPDSFGFLEKLTRKGLHVVESCWRLKANKLDDLPDLRESIMGCLSYGELLSALKFYPVCVMSGTSLKSRTNLARRAMEATACGAMVVFKGKSSDPFLRKFAVIEESDDEIAARIDYFLDHEHERFKATHLARRELLQEHSYAHRLKAICRQLDLACEWEEYPPVSVITPTKRPEFIDQCIEKFLAQSYPNKELIIILNSSKFDTGTIIEKVRKFNNINVYQHHEEMNIGFCLNFGISRAKGKYWFKVDDDDFYGENYLLDLILSQRSVESDLFGKFAAFTYMEAEDAIYCRREHGMHTLVDGFTPTMHLCGASLSGKVELLDRITFEEDSRASVDSNFVQAVYRSNGKVYFSDPFNMIVFRSADKTFHTWRMDDGTLKRLSSHVSDGMDFGTIMF